MIQAEIMKYCLEMFLKGLFSVLTFNIVAMESLEILLWLLKENFI